MGSLRADIVLLFCSLGLILLVSTSSSLDTSTAILVRVDQTGKGDFTRIQDAINVVPSNNTESVFIWVKPGIYREKVTVPADKPFITLSGSTAMSTIITYDEAWISVESPTVSILASDFVGRYLTIQNTYGRGGPAVALRVAGDRVAFYASRFIGFQDTLLDDAGRHYFTNCYIEGGTDFICGNARSLFRKCHLHSVSEKGGAFTAQRRSSAAEDTGYSFSNCKLTGAGVGTAILGRPWGAYSRVIFTLTYMSGAIQPQGWNDWNNPSNQMTAYYGEYNSWGPGSNTRGRVEWSHQFSLDEASQYMNQSWIDGRDWLRPTPSHFTKFSALPDPAMGNK
ncbi:putative pectinesterase 11 [Curcuma longa]|uniref:putative pectinesterase 11 n=1 Tax=Curcuma longa TaxID=136217 RepID=UPI003D9F4227